MTNDLKVTLAWLELEIESAKKQLERESNWLRWLLVDARLPSNCRSVVRQRGIVERARARLSKAEATNRYLLEPHEGLRR